MLGALRGGDAVGFLTERIVIRPLFDAPRVTLLVATAGVALLAIAVQQWLFDNQGDRSPGAFPTLDRVTDPRRADLRPALWLIGTLAVLAVLLGLFFTRTNLGLAIIGASQEPTATELVGISVRRLSTFTWVLAALLGGLAAVIAVPDTGQLHARGHDVGYLIPAFTAAVLGGMTSLPGAFLGGVIVGRRPGGRHERRRLRGHPGDAVDADRLPRPARRAGRAAAGPAREGRLMAVGHGRRPARRARPIAPGTAAGRSARRRSAGSPGVVLGPAVACLVLVFPLSRAGIDVRLSTPRRVCYAIVALSLNVLLGYVGQISLGHQAFVGIGAFTSAYLVTEQGQSFWVGVAATAIGGARRSSSAACRCGSGPLLRPRHAVLRPRRRAEHLPDPGVHRRRRRPARAEAGLVRHRLALLLPVPRLPGRRAVRRLADDAHQGRPGPAGPAGEPAGGVDLRHQRAHGHAVRVRRLRRLRRPGRRAHRPRRRRRCRPRRGTSACSLVFVIMTVVGGLRSRAGVVIGGAFFALLPYLIEQDPRLRGPAGQGPGPVDLTPELATLIIGPLLLLLTLIRSRAASASRSARSSAG